MAVPPDLPAVDEVAALVRRWLDVAETEKTDAGAERLAHLLKDPDGLDFTLGFVDRVVRPDDLRVAARNFERLSRRPPAFLPWHLRTLVQLGGGIGVLLPWPVIPLARRMVRRMVAHLVVDATPAKLEKTLAHLRGQGPRLNLTLLGEAVLGEREAERRLDGIRALVARDDVDYVSVRVTAVASRLSLWGFDETVERVVERLLPLYTDAAATRPRTFINLDMEEYRDLDLTVAVFRRLLDRPELHSYEGGIALQAYLPDSVAVLAELTEWAKARVASGGAPIKVRLVKGANLPMEGVTSLVHGWAMPTWPSKLATDTNYKRMLAAALTPEATDAVRIGVAGHNLFDIAFAWLLAEARGVDDRLDLEMLLGMATAQARAVRRDIRRLRLYTPVVHPEEFDAAIAYLVRRLQEGAAPENFLSSAFQLGSDEHAFARERERFAASLAELDDDVPPPNRTQNRLSPPLPHAPRAFRNEPDTDPGLIANRVWGRAILERSTASTLGTATADAARVDEEERLDALIAAAAEAGARWGRVPGGARAELLERAAEVLSVYRGRLIEVMASETGKTIGEADAEVSEAIDFALYYASRARELDNIRDARFAPAGVVLVVPPWNFPAAIPAGGVLSALAAGSAVVLKPAPQSRRTGAVLAEALWDAGVPRELMTLVDVDEAGLGRRLVTAPQFGRVLLTGSYATAELFRSWRHDLPLLAETSGKNAIIVTPAADIDLAVDDLVASAFRNAGQKCSAASLAILVGSVARSERFRRQLADAVTSLAVGYPQDPGVEVGPLVEPVGGALARGLTVLEEGESWLVKPRQLDASDRVWSPGVRDGVAMGSAFHRTEYFGPVLGLMHAETLDAAIAMQNAVPFGLTAGIHSLDADEVARWAERVQAGNLYVNRPITGAIVRRQPFGGWKRSSVGPATKAGGPHTLLPLGDWHPVPAEPDGDLRLDGLEPRVRAVIEAFQPALDYVGFDTVRRGARSDAAAWASEFGASRDVSQLGVERNLLRYRPASITVRLAEGGSLAELVRLLAAGALTGARLAVSSAEPLRLGRLAAEWGWSTVVEADDAFAARVAREQPERIRLIGGDARALAETLGGSPAVAVYAGAVTAAGRIELLPFLREQSVSITAHRFGTPDAGMQQLSIR